MLVCVVPFQLNWFAHNVAKVYEGFVYSVALF
jgi:hypothetical protein